MKYVLCRPEGGLNDMFVQISKCYEYCIYNGRTLLLDTVNNYSFKDNFSFYFRSNCDFLKLDYNEIKDILNILKLNNAECYPNINYINYLSHYSEEHNNFISNENNNLITFNFNIFYHETLLIHNACGGGIPNFILFEKIKLKDEIKNIFYERINKIENFFEKINYNAVHIRNTDIKTKNIDNFINNIPFKDGFFISTDDNYSLNKIKSLYKVIYFSDIPNVNLSLHLDIIDNDLKRSRNIDSIVDLFLLAFSHNLLGSVERSGYYMLANELMKKWQIRDSLFK
jgi:hypothetical protein